jgi:ketosteroid isomerase-like protein
METPAVLESQTQAFLDEMLPRQVAAERAIHNGDVEPRLALWSHHDPVTLFGAALSGYGWPQLSADFATVASWFSDSQRYEVEVVAAGASGDLAYMVGYEHNTVKVNGQLRDYTLRVTHVYRREDGQWRIVHRHADAPPGGEEHGLSAALPAAT